MAAPPSNNIIFLLGAGASRDAHVPDILEMTSDFFAHIRDSFSMLYPLLNQVAEMFKIKKSGKGPDIEQLLSIFGPLLTDNHLSPFLLDIKNSDSEKRADLKKKLESFIRDKVLVTDKIFVEYLNPLLDSGEWGNPTHVFSLNYDNCIELLWPK